MKITFNEIGELIIGERNILQVDFCVVATIIDVGDVGSVAPGNDVTEENVLAGTTKSGYADVPGLEEFDDRSDKHMITALRSF